MPRVHLRKARKDYPSAGIAKGDEYYTWRIKLTYGGQTYRSKTRPRPSQLTNSEWFGALGDLEYDGFDGVEDADGLRGIAEQIRELGEGQREKFDNMPEGLQQGDTGQMLEQRADAAESAADEIDQIADTLEEKLNEIQEAEDKHAELAAAWDAYDEAMDGWEEEDTGPPDEPEDEDPRDRDYKNERADAISEAVEEAKGMLPSE